MNVIRILAALWTLTFPAFAQEFRSQNSSNSSGGSRLPASDPGWAQMEASGQMEIAAPAIPMAQLGAEADKKVALAASFLTPTANGARLRALMQDLDAEVTPEGLWLTSTADEDAGRSNRFRVRAMTLGRSAGSPTTALAGATVLPGKGIVSSSQSTAMWMRPGVIEEYSVSTDGVRQDFVVLERPAGTGGRLVVDLEVTGARAEAADYGARLVVSATGRALAYSRLKVTDATGRELAAHLEVHDAGHLKVGVEDAGAQYPVRIDPTFSDADWVAVNPSIPGANSTVFATAVDGSGNLYVGGNFTAIGTTLANYIAKWNGSSWSPLGPGVFGNVFALAVSGSDLYAGGSFGTAGDAQYIARWDGTAWSALGSGVDSNVSTLVVSGTDLYVGGSFTTAGGISANHIAKWNGSAWSALGSGIGGNVNALAMSGGTLYAGGYFSTAGGTSANHVARWDGSAWSALGSGMNNEVRALAVSGSDLYAGGSFSTAGGTGVGYIARWSGSAWSALGSGMDDFVNTLAVSGSTLYAGGLFTTAGGISADRIARWNGSAWSAIGAVKGPGGIGGAVRSLTVSGGTLFVGGDFAAVGATGANNIAKWDGSAWSALGSGMGGNYGSWVHALAVIGSDLYAGGELHTAGGTSANYIAKWNGSAWAPLGAGTNGRVVALAVIGSDLYAGGDFTMAGGTIVNRVARWNGTTWSALGSGMDDSVTALAVSGSTLYAGGRFGTAGGTSANGVAKWNGTAWSALGSGVGGQVGALAVSGSDLYVGGSFTTAGGTVANSIAKWNGSVWSALGSGIDSGSVSALAVSGGDLYVGGAFTMAGGTSANCIAKWNGSVWSALGAGIGGDGARNISTLVAAGSDLYAGGRFSTAGGMTANHIAKWNGATWSALSSGMGGSSTPYVSALALDGSGRLFAGGGFLTAGSVFSPYVARANIGEPEIAVSGNSAAIVDGDSTPSLADFTDFGAVLASSGSVVRTFTITNSGVSALDLTGTPRVAVIGAHAADFVITLLPASSVAASGGSTNFQVTFDPSAAGMRSAVVSIANDDSDENPFDFAVSGTGFAPSSNADLSNLTPSMGVMSPAFAANTTAYTVNVPNASSTITITPVAADSTATIRVEGVVVASGSPSGPINLNVGNNTINTVVTAQDGVTSKSYTVIVNRAPPPNPDLAALTLSSGVLSPAFAAATTAYTANVPNVASTITVTPTAADGTATIRVNGTVVASGSASVPISLSVGSNPAIDIVVTAQDGVTTKAYQITPTRFLPITVTTAPKDVSVVVGDRAVFAAVASGSGALACQWKKNGSPVPGATTPVLVIDPAGFGDSGRYALEITDAALGSATSYAAGLFVSSPREGDVDFSFYSAPSINDPPLAAARQADGKWIVVGSFVSVNNAVRSSVARLNSDGTTDYTFGAGLAGANGNINTVAIQNDGKILIGGAFTTIDGVARGGIARLNTDGSLDTSFANTLAGTNGTVNALALQTDGKVVIAGTFTTVNGTTRTRVARLDENGILDPDFGNGLAGADATVNTLVLQPSDGKVLIGGSFANVHGSARGRVARLNTDGTLDTTFANGLAGADNTVNTIAVQADNRIVIGGAFLAVNGTSRGRVAQLNDNGTLDTTFGNGLSGADNIVNAVATLPGNKVIVGGTYLNVNGSSRVRLVRLNSDGTVDSSYGVSGNGSNGMINFIAIHSGGKALIGGTFTTVNSAPRTRLAQLTADGQLDTAFDHGLVGLNNTVNVILPQAGGGVLIGGNFVRVDGVARSRLARLEANGTLDLTYANGLSGANGPITAMSKQSDDKVIVGGSFTSIHSTARSGIARVNTDGTVDTTFGNGMAGIGANTAVNAVLWLSDGKILIGGSFTTVNGTAQGGIARLNNDGSLDTTFATGLAGTNGTVNALALQTDGKILIGGTFTTVHGTARTRIARLNDNGTLDAFGDGLAGPNNTVTAIVFQPSDGKVLVGGTYSSMHGTTRGRIARLNTNGTLDTSFGNLLAGANTAINAVALQSDGKVLVGGSFTSMNGVAKARLARLNTDGTLDVAYGNGLAGVGRNGNVLAIALEAGGKPLVGGTFGTVNGSARNHLVRMQGAGTDADLTSLTTSSGTLSPVFDSGLTAYSMTITASSVAVTPVSRDPAATIRVRLNGGAYSIVPSGTTSAAVTLGSGANTLDVEVTSSNSLVVKPYSLTLTRSAPLDDWRLMWFGTSGNTGNAADTADFDNDGLANLIEWACLLNPTTSSTLSTPATVNGSVIEYIYTRSTAAVNAGAGFTVEWSDDFTGWSQAGVTQQVLSDNGIFQQVKATIPAGSNDHRFVHLTVTAPP